jgi:hypothetical protein
MGQAGDQFQDRGFAAAIWPHQGCYFTLRQVEADIV